MLQTYKYFFLLEKNTFDTTSQQNKGVSTGLVV